MTGDLGKAWDRVTDPAKLDIIATTQAKDNERCRLEVSRSFISDTLTVPSKEMCDYAVQASLGDDVYHEPNTAALEAHMARLFGKEAALFVPSGTMSNQLAMRTHLKQPPYSVLCDHRAHVYACEAGGVAFHSGAQVIPVIPSNRHHLTLDDIQKFIVLDEDIHFALTQVIELENTLHGSIFPQDEIIRISEFARKRGIKMHLDGARIWHVAVETGTPLDVLCEPFDSISACFSKGLGAPVGSCLMGSKEFIARARWFRKTFGGGMRQTGFFAASVAYALTHNFPKLAAVHQLTRRLERGLLELGVEITGSVETCMVFYNPSPIGTNYTEIAERAEQLPSPLLLGGSRLVVHIQTSEQAIDDFLNVLRSLAEEKKAAGFVRPAGKVDDGSYKDIYVRRK
ncbi:pyridoxal phosphate-dependent transferase [Multifurca ochricompacta]|uniref:Pyridoxal phosphate-dependent transferase n=1 Tax=Multifurca ochricompacta TaxID=376703 RepID=A0AAD4MCF0_9AGAM|nr:pyridoxal phosphate-dependent transferase [Multifurca ochricompacta]